jgi:UDP-N-acetylmuramyl tripeptide synthase
LAATGAVLEINGNLAEIKRGIETCTGAPGRFERVLHNGDFAVVVDYAHTDDALLNVLKTARNTTQNRVSRFLVAAAIAIEQNVRQWVRLPANTAILLF